MNEYQTFQAMTIFFVLLSMVVLIIMVVLYFAHLKFFRESKRLLKKVYVLMAEIEKRVQPAPDQTEVLSEDMIQSTEEHIFEIGSESEEIQQETESRKQSIVDAYQNRIDETEMTTNKSLDETFDTHIESEDHISERADEDTVEIEINLAFDNDIKDEILKFLKDANEARHFTDIINHLSNVLPNIDPDDFMIELDQLEKSGKIEAGLVGGKLHYNLNSRSLG